MSIFSKKQSIQGLIKELEEDKEKLEYLLVHVNLLKNIHKIAFNKTHIKDQRFLIMNQLQGLVHEMSEELKKINKSLPKKIDFDNIKEHEEKISKFNEDYDKLINDIKTENEYHKKILDEINEEESFEDKERNLEIDLEKELKVDDKIIEDLQQLNKTVDENLKFYNDYFNKLGTEIKESLKNYESDLSKKIKKIALEIQQNIILIFALCDQNKPNFDSSSSSSLFVFSLMLEINTRIDELSELCFENNYKHTNLNRVYSEIHDFLESIYMGRSYEIKPTLEELNLGYQQITKLYPFLEDKNNIAKDENIIFFILKKSMYNYVTFSKDNVNDHILIDDLRKDKIINDLDSLVLFISYYSNYSKSNFEYFSTYSYFKKENINSKDKIEAYFKLINKLSEHLVVDRSYVSIEGYHYFISFNNLKMLLKLFETKLNKAEKSNTFIVFLLLKFAANQEFDNRIIDSIKNNLLPVLKENKNVYDYLKEFTNGYRYDGISDPFTLFNHHLERSRLFILKVITILYSPKDFVLYYVQSKSIVALDNDKYQTIRNEALNVSDLLTYRNKHTIIDIIHRDLPFTKKFLTHYLNYLITRDYKEYIEVYNFYELSGYMNESDWKSLLARDLSVERKNQLIDVLKNLIKVLDHKSSKDFLDIENEIKELFIKYENEKDTNHLTSFLTELINKIKKQRRGIKVNPFDFSNYAIIERKLYFILEKISFETQMGIYKYNWFHKLLEFNELLNNVNYSEKEFNKFISSLSKEKDFRVALNMVFNRTREIVSQTAIELKNNFNEKEYDKSVLWGANTINFALFKIKEPKKASTAYGKKYIKEFYSK